MNDNIISDSFNGNDNDDDHSDRGDLGNTGNSNVAPLESVELNTLAGHISSVGENMMGTGPEDYEYLQGWGGGRNGTVAPLPQVQENEEVPASESIRQEDRVLNITLRIPCQIVPILLVTNVACGLILKGFQHFFSRLCSDFFQQIKADASFPNTTVPSGCLPPGWHRDYVQEFPPNPSYGSTSLYSDAFSHEYQDSDNYLSTIRTISVILLVSSVPALINVGILAMERCLLCCCCYFKCCAPALGLRLRILSCLGLGVWGIVSTLLHLVDILVHGRVWWLLVLSALIIGEMFQMMIYDAYRREWALPKFRVLARRRQNTLVDGTTDHQMDTPLLPDSEANNSRGVAA